MRTCPVAALLIAHLALAPDALAHQGSAQIRAVSPTPARAGNQIAISGAGFGAMAAVVKLGAEVAVFGPQTYKLKKGKPVAVTTTFRVKKLSDMYTLRVVNQGVTSAGIGVNGTTILGPTDELPAFLERVMTLRAGTNAIAVELHGLPGHR
jgi:hypothetical protein